MDQENQKRSDPSFIKDLFATVGVSLLRITVILLIAFAIGTGGTAIVRLYYGAPIWLSLIGGLLVVGFAVALIAYG